MGLDEAGNVVYYGIVASFFGGWVPIRSKNIKLIVFHLYLFISMLVIPLIIYLVDSTRIVGWVLYGVWTLLVFGSLKIMNYRLHKALGTDPVPEEQKDENSVHDEEEEEEVENREDQVKEKTTEQRGIEEGEKMAEVVVLSNEETLAQTSIRHRSSASTLNDLGSSQNPGTPEIELSQLSQIPVADESGTVGTTTVAMATIDSESPIEEDVPIELPNNDTAHSLNGDTEYSDDDERQGSGSRQRVCHRYTRQESLRRIDQLNSSTSPDVIRQHIINNHSLLAPVIDKIPPQVLEAIFNETMSPETCQSLAERLSSIPTCHLAADSEDYSRGAIHWFEEDDKWDFYAFDPPSLDGDSLDQLQALFRTELLAEQIRPSLRRPTPPPKPITPISSEDHALQSEPVPSIMLIPRISKTKVNLNFARSQLEEYMDRNVSRLEVAMAIMLAVLVCVISALLLTLTDFFSGFWIFALCFVIATSHFSLIKSVQSDPASPSPGQNRINAMSRSVYFITIGSLGLLLDGVLRHTTTFTPACLYGFNYNNETIITFMRDGLFIFILFLPVLFTLGWMPQFDTFLIAILEHIELHVFGGTASTGLVCSLYSLIRNVLVMFTLSPLGYLAFVTLETDTGYIGDNCSVTFSTYSQDMINHQIRYCSTSGRLAFSFFLASVVSIAYMLSRATSNHQYIRDLLAILLKKCWYKMRRVQQVAPPTEDPLDRMYLEVMRKRLLADLLVALFLFLATTLINLTSLFCQTEIIAYVIYGITAVLGLLNHYILPHIRKETPYLCFSEPCLKSNEYGQFEVTDQPKVSIAERILQVMLFLEKNIFYPLTFLFAFNLTAVYYRAKFGEIGAAFVVSIVGMKLFRSAYSELPRQHVILILSLLFFNVDYAHLNEGLPFNYFITAILFNKIYDLYLKVYFILIYIMPGSWSSPFHIIIQPLLIPHCPLIFFETLIGAIVSAPMNPIIASSMFFLSYARPIKFWEKDYNTKRRDTSNTRLEQQLDTNIRNPNPDHLDSLFYEQLSWSLQRDLCGDIMLGRWGRVFAGDFFILTNDQLNALVHIIEIGNGFVTFQLRGLEFRGTYCHQREREAISEPMADEDSCCKLPYMLPCGKVFTSRWMAWEVISSCYTLHGYSISENQAHLVFNAYDYKKAFITYYVKSIIYFLIKYPRLGQMLENEELQQSLINLSTEDAVDLDPLLDQGRNIDWKTGGIRRAEFVSCYHDFIENCAGKHLPSEVDTSRGSFLVTLCFGFSLLGRRMFFTHASTGSGRRGYEGSESTTDIVTIDKQEIDNFMHGLYRMFLGDARPNSEKDDWIFVEVDSIQEVIIPAARIALKVHQDNFTLTDEYESSEGIYEAIKDAEENHVITHENDRAWRDGVILDRPSLIALRYQRTEDTYIHPYKIIRLTSKFIKFRLVKVNRECVRGLWSSQQHELIFLRNSDSERGSIQNHKATLRNMINSSMDLPIGYPIYVSPLQTSFLDRHAPFNETHMGRLSNPLDYVRFVGVVRDWCSQCSRHYQGSRRADQATPKNVESSTQALSPGAVGGEESITGTYQYEDPFGGDSDSDDDFWKPIWIGKQVTIVDEEEVFLTFNEHWLQWPDKAWPRKAAQSHWKGWVPRKGTTGQVIHEWRPFHIASTSRSHIDKVIVLMKVNDLDNLVLIKEQGVNEV